MTKLSLLDLVPVVQGGSIPQALANAADIAAHAESLGFARYWVAEHHGMAGVAGGATSVVLAHVGAATKTIRIGAGGIMLPNHAPLQIAEQWGTLDALYPGRIDLGLGRAPGSDGRVAQAMRRGLASDEQQFPRDVVELIAYFDGDPRVITATPGAGADIDIWILGSSLFGAQLAAMLGVKFAFASHFAPDALMVALEIYRRDFQPSERLAAPYCAAAFNVFAANTCEEAELMATSMQQSFVALRSGNPGRMPPPTEGYLDTLSEQARGMLDHVLQYSAIGTGEDVARGLEAFVAETRVDEVIVAASIYDHDARKHSLTLAAKAFAGVPA